MIFRNYYTGTLHEVPDPDSNLSGQTVFDGFGNPVGGIFDDIGKAIGSIASVAAPIAQTLLPGPAGALIGAAYARGMDVTEMADRARGLQRRDLFRLNRMGMLLERQHSPAIYLEEPLRNVVDPTRGY